MRVRRPVATTAAVALVAGTIWSAAPAAAAPASDLASAILTPAAAAYLTGSTITTPSDDASAVGTGTDPVAGFPSRAGGTYAVLSTGDARELTIAGQDHGASTAYSSSATRGGAYDVTTLELTLNVPPGANCLLGVSFRFLSEEFPQPDAQYNDAFIAEVGASTWSIVGGTINAPGNFAFDDAGRVMSVNSGLFDEDSARAEATGTVFDGATPKLTAQVPLTGGTQQKLFFSIFDHGDDIVDSAVMIDHLRIGTVDDPADDCRPGATTSPTEILVSAAAPTQVDVSGTAGDTYTVPVSEGVTYSVGGTPVAAGTYPGTGTVVVTAQAQAGYAVSGPSQFTLVFSDVVHVTATEPAWTDTWGTAEDTYTIPSVTGVQYAVDGEVVAAGTYPATGTVTVDAAATSGYALTGATEFTHTFTDIRQATATEPTWTDTWGTAEDTYTIPSVTGVLYSVDGTPVAAGTYPATGTVTVDAVAAAGYVLTATARFTRTFTDLQQATASEPTWTDTWGTAEDTYTIPSVTGVQYAVDGEVVAAGTYPATGTVTVDAAATPGYALTGATEFTHTFTDIRQATATEPTWTDTWGTAEDTYTIPSVTGVLYSVDGTPVAAGTYPATGTVTVDAVAAAGYVLTATARYTRTFTDIRLVTATAPTFDDPWQTADDTVTIPEVTGVQYAIDGTPVAPGTYPASGTVVVTATATTGHELTGATEFSHTFTDIRQVSAPAPAQTDTYGTADDTYTIPSVTGVQYSVDGDVVAPGTYPGAGTVVVTASATAGYALSGVSQFTLVFTDIVLATPVEPTWHDVDGTSADTYTIPATTGVVHTVDGSPVAPGTYPATGTVTVDATAAIGYELTGTTQFTFTFTDITHVSALAPTVVDQPGTALDRVTIPQVTGVAYLVDGAPAAAGTHAHTGDVLVTAQAADARHVLVGTSSFPLHLSDADVPGAPVLVAEAGSGSVALSWAEPAGDPTGYELQTSPDGTVWASAGTTTSTRATLDALVDGTAVSFRVRGVNGLGHGAWSAPVTATPVSLPTAPSITRVQADSRRLWVTVTAPASDGGSPVIRYERTLDGGRTWAVVDGSPLELTGLVNGTPYRIQVRAVTAVGAGAASTMATGTPVAAPVTVPGGDGTTARPRVEPGVVQAWAGGAPAPVTVGVQDGRRTVAGPRFDVTLGGADAGGTQLPVDASGRIVVAPDGFVSVSGGGFAPGEVVDVWLFSTPVLLGSVTVQADGTFAGRLRLPAGVPAGRHTLQINGTRADGTLVSVAAGVLVAAAATAADEPDELAATGAPAGSAALLALWLLVAGAGAVHVARRAHRV